MPGKRGRGKTRYHRDRPTSESVTNLTPQSEPFLKYRQLLDSRNDKYERLVKISRDLTIDSKRTIFHLHRYVSNDTKLMAEADIMIQNCISNHISRILSELDGCDPYIYARAYSPGMQEFIEGYTFYHYLKHGSIPRLDNVSSQIHATPQDSSAVEEGSIDSRQQYPLYLPSESDFILGIADLSDNHHQDCEVSSADSTVLPPHTIVGELMSVLQLLQQAFSAHCIGSGVRDMNNKLSTLRSSVAKVEAVCYTIRVRGSEIPKHLLADSVHSAEPVNMAAMPHADTDAAE